MFELCRCYRLCGLVMNRRELDDAMNWLSTLGGAYSSLGDYFIHHVCRLQFIYVTAACLGLCY